LTVASKRSPLHLVQASATETGVVIGQVRVSDTSNEMTALPALLDLLFISGKTVTLDAVHTQRSTVKVILTQKRYYVLDLKGNQRTLNAYVRLSMEDPSSAAKMAVSDAVIERGHRRMETAGLR